MTGNSSPTKPCSVALVSLTDCPQITVDTSDSLLTDSDGYCVACHVHGKLVGYIPLSALTDRFWVVLNDDGTIRQDVAPFKQRADLDAWLENYSPTS